MSVIPQFLRLSIDYGIPRRSMKVALVVGTVLNIINQFDGIFGPEDFHVIRALLTYLVPYCVSSFAAVQAYRQLGPPRS